MRPAQLAIDTEARFGRTNAINMIKINQTLNQVSLQPVLSKHVRRQEMFQAAAVGKWRCSGSNVVVAAAALVAVKQLL